MKHLNIRAFTLVELIVVITILAILATVGFISFQWYTSSSRDSVRLADLKNISKSFEINKTQLMAFPLPDNKVDISSSGTIFQYQWELSTDTLKKELNIFNGWVDPVTKKPYWYVVNTNRNKYQIIGFLENSQEISMDLMINMYADNTQKFIKTQWNPLGVLVDQTNNEVIIDENSTLEIDISSTSTDYWVVKNDTVENVSWADLLAKLKHRINPRQSCNTILLNWDSVWNGTYIINPTGIAGQDFEVYCDMESNNGWWTLFYANNGSPNSPIKQSYVDMRNNVFNQTQEYDLTKFDNNYLAGLIDYRLFTDNWSDQVMVKDYNDLEKHIITQFDSSQNLAWALWDGVLWNTTTSCIQIPNNWHMNISLNFDTNNANNIREYTNLNYIMIHSGQSWWISHTAYNCNWFTSALLAHYWFYQAYSNLDENRARHSYTYSWASTSKNKFRYFIK